MSRRIIYEIINAMQPKKDSEILIIGDQRIHLRLIKQMLAKYGWQAVGADSAEEALLILEWNPEFYAIITDLKMPRLDGIEFCKIAKKNIL